ncbi:NUDIX domain-containing protein [Nesterenkonia sphaerica]|uniref:8-oxo-dGTP diphosphatase n=1 Tax=Nesterenkonia sphaerica TaxID=1804988 RepID=A0A5R9A2P5_9MICC|nr:NUDIX domain-containing protein [Nesterenkonia sphaerica]
MIATFSPEPFQLRGYARLPLGRERCPRSRVKVEPGETPKHALVREVPEELNVVVTVTTAIGTDVTWVGETAIQLTCFHAHLRGAKTMHSSDHDQLRWLPVTELDQLECAPPGLPAVRRLMSAANVSGPTGPSENEKCVQTLQGSISCTPVAVKSLVFRVAHVAPCARQIAAIWTSAV